MAFPIANSVREALTKAGLPQYRVIGGSKSLYRARNPGHLVVFDANIFTEARGKVWYGDLDLTLDGPVLQGVAIECKQSLYILSKNDGSLQHEIRPFAEVIMLAVRYYPHHIIKPTTI